MAASGDRLAEIRAYLREGLWRQEFEPGTWAGRGARLLQFSIMVGEGFVRDQLLLRASALTYFTVLSIVPLLAIVSAVATAVGVTENVAGPIIDQIAAGAPQVAETLRQFVATANIGALGTLGAFTLFLTTVLGISNIERALNNIWGVQQERPWSRRLPDYLAVLIVAPLVLGAGLSLATTVKSQWVIQRLLEYPVFEMAYDLGLEQLPTVVLAGGFAFIYWFLPNTSVRPLAAFLGGITSAVGVNAALALYVGFSVGVARADALYGGFAQLPLFFVWTYVFWAVVLFGAEIAFAYQNLALYVREVRGEAAGPAEREAIGLRIALEIARSFRDTGSPWTEDDLSDRLSVPVRTVRDVLVPLQRARIVASVDDSERRTAGWQLGRPADAIQIIDLLGALRGPREPIAGAAEVTRAVEALLAEIHEGEVKAAAGQSLGDVLAGISTRPDPPQV